MKLSPIPCILHALPISPPWLYQSDNILRSTNYKTPYYVIFLSQNILNISCSNKLDDLQDVSTFMKAYFGSGVLI